MKNLLLLSASLVFAFVLIEGVLRLFYEVPPLWKEPQIQHLHSPLLGWVLPPNTNRFFTIDVPVVTNAAGLRDDEIPLAKPPGETRVLALGDSFTFALGIAFDDLWVQRLERLLAEKQPGRRFQVINAGVAGYNTRQELIYLLSDGFSWNPDAVVLEFYWNDLVDQEAPIPDLATTPRIPPQPEFQERDQSNHTIPTWLRERFRQSVTLYLLVTRSKALWASFHPPTAEIERVQRAILQGDAKALAPNFEATRKRLLEVAEAGRQHGVPIVLAYFPDENEVVRPGVGLHLGDWVRNVWSSTGFPFVDLTPDFVASRQAGRNPFLPYDLHPSAIGMDVAAKALYPATISALRASDAAHAPQPAPTSAPVAREGE